MAILSTELRPFQTINQIEKKVVERLTQTLKTNLEKKECRYFIHHHADLMNHTQLVDLLKLVATGSSLE